MRKLNMTLVQPAMTLAKTVWNDRGDLLLSAGSKLSDSRIKRLHELGILSVYVNDDDITDEIEIRDMIGERTRQEAGKRLRDLYDFVADSEETQAKALGKSTREVLERVGRGGKALENILSSVAKIIDEVLQGDFVLGLSTLKSRDGYAFQHGVDVAVTAALIATKAQLPQTDLRSLVSGCLVIDIGNLLVPDEILKREDHLDMSDMAEVQRHCEAGFNIVRELGLKDVLAAHIPYQHHERQDGSGYPRGLRGNNRINRSQQQVYDGKFILQIAELAAIADVYDALCSDRPYRPALSVDDAANTIYRMAGTELNSQMVEAFLSLVPVFPLGARVILSGGPYQGEHGIVMDQDQFDAQRPIIRLYEDPEGAPMNVIVKTVENPDIRITPLQVEELAVAAAG